MNLMGEVVNPSFVATDPDFKHLYAVSELEGNKEGEIAAFSIDRNSGALTFLNKRSAAGLAPCHLAVDHTGKMLIAANYTSGSVPVFPIEHDGKLGELVGSHERQGDRA